MQILWRLEQAIFKQGKADPIPVPFGPDLVLS